MKVKGSFTKSGIMINNRIYNNLSEYYDEMDKGNDGYECSCGSDWW